VPPELGVERPPEGHQVQAGQRAGALTPAQRDDQPVDPADGLGQGRDLLGAAAVSLVAVQPGVGGRDGADAFLAPPGHVHDRAQAEEPACGGQADSGRAADDQGGAASVVRRHVVSHANLQRRCAYIESRRLVSIKIA
jgi:hypothetical protein